MSGEQYKLRCFSCHSEITIPTTQRECSKCGQKFDLDWEAERQAYESKGDRVEQLSGADTSLTVRRLNICAESYPLKNSCREKS
jgi:hypothetical protein